MNSMVKSLKDAEADMGKELIKGLITGERKLTVEEYGAALKKYGVRAITSLQAMENLNAAQKGYLLKRLGYND